MLKIKLVNKSSEEHWIPRSVNFVRRVSDDFPVPLGELSDAEIRKLGKAITESMLARAVAQRLNKTEFNLAPRRGYEEQ